MHIANINSTILFTVAAASVWEQAGAFSGPRSAFSTKATCIDTSITSLKAANVGFNDGLDMESRMNNNPGPANTASMPLARVRDDRRHGRPNIAASFESLDFSPEVRTRDQIFNYLEDVVSSPDMDVMGGPETRTRDQTFAYLDQVEPSPDFDIMGGPEARTRDQTFSRLEPPHFSRDFDVHGGPEFRTRIQSHGALGDDVPQVVRAYSNRMMMMDSDRSN